MNMGHTFASFNRRCTTNGVTPNRAATSSKDYPESISALKAWNSSAGCMDSPVPRIGLAARSRPGRGSGSCALPLARESAGEGKEGSLRVVVRREEQRPALGGRVRGAKRRTGGRQPPRTRDGLVLGRGPYSLRINRLSLRTFQTTECGPIRVGSMRVSSPREFYPLGAVK
jgi:hypothetical protein